MTGTSKTFDPTELDGLDEPVRLYLARALRAGAPLARSWSLRMKGSIRVGLRLPFEARQELDGRSFTWRARVPTDRLCLLKVTDSYRDGHGGTVGRIFGRQVFADQGEDASRSAATRSVMESTMVPATLLPRTGVEWTGASDGEIRFRRPEIPEAEEVTIRTDPSGRPLEVEALRWRAKEGRPGELVPFLCRFEGEMDVNGMSVPEKVSAGWVEGGFKPFFRARLISVEGTRRR